MYRFTSTHSNVFTQFLIVNIITNESHHGLIQEVEKLTLENSKLIEENKDLHETVDILQSKTQEMEASMEEKNTYLLKLADEMTKRDATIKTNEELLTAANQKVCIRLLTFKTLACVYVCTCTCIHVGRVIGAIIERTT